MQNTTADLVKISNLFHFKRIYNDNIGVKMSEI